MTKLVTIICINCGKHTPDYDHTGLCDSCSDEDLKQKDQPQQPHGEQNERQGEAIDP